MNTQAQLGWTREIPSVSAVQLENEVRVLYAKINSLRSTQDIESYGFYLLDQVMEYMDSNDGILQEITVGSR